MSASFVLASLRDSPYDKEYASPLRSLRPCWSAFLNIRLLDYIQFDAKFLELIRAHR